MLSHVQLCNPIDYKVHGILQARILEWVSLSFLQGIFPTQGSNPGLPHCRWILSQLSHKGNPRILERAAYPFLQWLFPTQELNWGLLHCRWILYQLSYQGSQNTGVSRVAVPFSSQPRDQTMVSFIASYQLSHKGSPRIVEWLAYLSPGDLLDTGIGLGLLHCRWIFLPTVLSGKPENSERF